MGVWWLNYVDLAAQLWECGGSTTELWWLDEWGCDGSLMGMWLLNYRDVAVKLGG